MCTASTASSKTKSQLPGPGVAGGFGGNRRRCRRLLHVQLAEHAADDLSATTSPRRRASVFRAAEGARLRRHAVRNEAGLLYQQGRHDGCPMFLVHKKGLKLDGNNPTLLYAYGGFNIVQAPDVQRLAAGAARAGLRLREREHARRRRVWREVARGRNEAEEAKRVRRLHRRGGVADREQVHVDAASSRSRADRTAGCWSAP